MVRPAPHRWPRPQVNAPPDPSSWRTWWRSLMFMSCAFGIWRRHPVGQQKFLYRWCKANIAATQVPSDHLTIRPGTLAATWRHSSTSQISPIIVGQSSGTSVRDERQLDWFCSGDARSPRTNNKLVLRPQYCRWWWLMMTSSVLYLFSD